MQTDDGQVTQAVSKITWTATDGGLAPGQFDLFTISAGPLPTNTGKLTFKVIHGVTGSGKSRLLRALAAAGAQVLDLEDLAAHRGSLLGSLPERPQPVPHAPRR